MQGNCWQYRGCVGNVCEVLVVHNSGYVGSLYEVLEVQQGVYSTIYMFSSSGNIGTGGNIPVFSTGKLLTVQWSCLQYNGSAGRCLQHYISVVMQWRY